VENENKGNGNGEKAIVAAEKAAGEGAYVIAIAIILTAMLVSAAIYVSVSSLTGTVAQLGIAAGAQQQGSGTGYGAAGAGQQAGAGAQQQGALPNQVARINLADLPFLGGADAKVSIVEYADFQCPYCKLAYPTMRQVLGDYGNRVKFYFKNYPLQFHQNAQKAAEAYECALEQGKQWEYYDKLFENSQGDGTGLAVPDLKKYAVDLGLDTAKFNGCLDSGKEAAKVRSEAAEGGQNGVSGTPTFFVNGEALVGAQPYSAFKSMIDSKLAG